MNFGLTASVWLFLLCVLILVFLCSCQCCFGLSPEKACNPFYWGTRPFCDCWGWCWPCTDPLPGDKVDIRLNEESESDSERGEQRQVVPQVVPGLLVAPEAPPVRPVYADPAPQAEAEGDRAKLPLIIMGNGFTRHSKTGFVEQSRRGRREFSVVRGR